MLRQLEIQNFKSHENSVIKFSNLTVLCGANGVGKSSVIQALLVLRESFLDKSNSSLNYLNLKTDAINIGCANDALYQFCKEEIISFKITSDIQIYKFEFKVDIARDSTKTLIEKLKTEHQFDASKINEESLFNTQCQFISAARLGPLESYPKNDAVVDIHNQISVKEGKAEYFIHYLNRKRNMDVMDELCHPKATGKDLFAQTTAWEKEISENVNVVVQDIGNLGYELKYQFNTSSSLGRTNEFKATNVGFGLTYAMPIIVAILAAPKGSILFIENPEAHLHPSSQAKLAELISLAAQSGIQIVLETHSDHIINGILVQIKRKETEGMGISKEHVSMYHFTRNNENHTSIATPIVIENEGRITYAPKGFFDQFTNDRKYLMGF